MSRVSHSQGTLTTSGLFELEPWVMPQTPLRLGRGQAHVWGASLTVSGAELHAAEKVLNPAELTRCMQMIGATKKRESVVSRAILREVLSLYVDTLPEAFEIREGPNGKPFAEGDEVPGFNVSHSHGVALFAFAFDSELGVDIESVESRIDASRLSERLLPPESRSLFHSLDPREHARSFSKSWTEQEARLKAAGDGLSALARNWNDPNASNRYVLHDLPVGPNFSATLAAEPVITKVATFRWPGFRRSDEA